VLPAPVAQVGNLCPIPAPVAQVGNLCRIPAPVAQVFNLCRRAAGPVISQVANLCYFTG